VTGRGEEQPRVGQLLRGQTLAETQLGDPESVGLLIVPAVWAWAALSGHGRWRRRGRTALDQLQPGLGAIEIGAGNVLFRLMRPPVRIGSCKPIPTVQFVRQSSVPGKVAG
jgi:hypothetical protein